jgi:transporter family-2 protein
VLAFSVGILALSLRGLPAYYATTGLFGVAFIASAAYLVPSLGVAVFFGAATAGSALGALFVDQAGAFGATPAPISAARVGGLALIVIGVVVLRLDR